MHADKSYQSARRLFPHLERVQGSKVGTVRYVNYPCRITNGKIEHPPLAELAEITSTTAADELGLIWKPEEIARVHAEASERRRRARKARYQANREAEKGRGSSLAPVWA
jgi:hypothetical protein